MAKLKIIINPRDDSITSFDAVKIEQSIFEQLVRAVVDKGKDGELKQTIRDHKGNTVGYLIIDGVSGNE